MKTAIFNFLARPSQLCVAFIPFSYPCNGLDEGSFYCGSLLNVYKYISLFITQLSCLFEKYWKFFLSLFSILFKVSAKRGKLKIINIFDHNIRSNSLFYWIYSAKSLLKFRFHSNIWNEIRMNNGWSNQQNEICERNGRKIVSSEFNARQLISFKW